MEEKEVVSENDLNKPKKKKNKKKIILIIIAIIVVLLGLTCAYLFYFKDKLGKSNEVNVQSQPVNSPYKITGNALDTFDLAFLKLENDGKNMIYSPLSIKYALEMLSDGTAGESKAQIDAIIGDYVAKTYTNSKNMSFANALFVRDTFKDSINQEYINNLTSKFNASVVYDSFASPKTINKWVSDKTLNLVDNLLNDVSEEDFVLVNALAIDQEWKKVIHPNMDWEFEPTHEKFTAKVVGLSNVEGYPELNFEGLNKTVTGVDYKAVANKYDIIKEIGEKKIRETVLEAYKKWVKENPDDKEVYLNGKEYSEVNNAYLDEYIKEISKNYNVMDSSTDFYFYDNNTVKAFAKDLKTYNNTSLQYVGIMPKSTSLKNYIEQVDAKSISELINNLKDNQSTASYEEGYITHVFGSMPLFKYEKELDLMKDLNTMGITNVFDKEKADLSKLTSAEGAHMTKTVHKANIELSNEGIKAAAATSLGGAGDVYGGFYYDFEVPVKEIDITFDKPFMYIIRDKDTGEVWFAGTVYSPEYTPQYTNE